MKNEMNDVILVPTDFSEICDNAINQAAENAKILKYRLYLLHVINKDTWAYLNKVNLGIGAINDKLEAKAAEVRTKYKLEVETKALEGSIFTTISEVAQDIGAALIYLGTHGKVGMQKLTGSFAIKVITSSSVPVIVVQKRPPRKGFKNIVLPITSDAGPWEKTKWAVFIARQFGATIHLFQTSTSDESVVEAAKLMDEYFRKNKVKHTYMISEKSTGFSGAVINYATSLDADMILIMTNPDASFSKFLLGTYDEEMIFNNSQIPVMCINPRKFSYQILGL
ncbi:MAG TPA: universal stress protein [Bacteroidales bacterium]|nr:universal stress protein [Bacteroidales bacterium]